MAFDPKKPVTTRDGRKVTILMTDLKDARQPIVAILDAGTGNESVEQFSADGKFFHGGRASSLDLVNSKVERTVYINIYANANRGNCPGATVYLTRQAADEAASESRTACVPVTFEE